MANKQFLILILNCCLETEKLKLCSLSKSDKCFPRTKHVKFNGCLRQQFFPSAETHTRVMIGNKQPI